MSDAAILDDVKAHIKDIKNDKSGSTGYAIYTELNKITVASDQHAEAQKLLAQLKPQLSAAVREMNRDDYETAVQGIFPHMNGIKVKTVRAGSRYALMAYHSYFTSQTFDLGGEAREVQDWINKNYDDLVYADVVRVGVSSNQGYGGQWYNVKQ